MNVERRNPVEKEKKIQQSENLRVCAYCRVSTDIDDQKNSLQAQKSFFDRQFQRHPNWINIGIFADEGISGTSLKKREKFLEMLRKARAGEVDIILTKEVSRFSRNATDFLSIVDELRKKSVYIYFINEEINTEDIKSMQTLTELAAAAQAESIRTSNRVKWGQVQSMELGTVFGRKEMFGYNIRRDEQGKQFFEIIEAEAEIIKKIFEWFSQGEGTFRIAKRLESQGIKTKRYKNGWSNTVILRILRNEKYVGDLEQGKTYTPDPLTHQKKYNRNDSVSFYIKNHHPESAIIDRKTWDKVQEILAEKAPSEEIKAMHSNRYWTSGKVYCGLCGGRYISYNKKQKNGKYKAWVCFKNHKDGCLKQRDINGETVEIGCDGKRVNDRVLKMAIHDIITEFILPNREAICNDIIKETHTPKKVVDNSKKIKAKEKAIGELFDKQTKLTLKYAEDKISEEMYEASIDVLKKQQQELVRELDKIKTEQVDLSKAKRLSENYVNEIEKLIDLKNEDFNENLYERVTKRIIVFPDNILEFHLSFLPKPIKLQYTTKGRGDAYTADFTIL